jgi:hypothetical protein
LKIYVARSTQRGKTSDNQRLCEGHKECMQESLIILEFEARTKLRRDRDFKEFKGEARVEVTLQKEISGGRMVVKYGSMRVVDLVF